MEKKVICAYCGKEYVAKNESDCCPFCGSFNEFTITSSDKFLYNLKKHYKFFIIFAIIIFLIIVGTGLKNFLTFIWYQNEYEDVQEFQYYYSDDYISLDTSYIDNTKELDKTIQIMVDGDNYENIISLIDNFVPNQFHNISFEINIDKDLEIKDSSIYIANCHFTIYDNFASFGMVIENRDAIKVKDVNFFIKDTKGNLYTLDIQKDFSDANSIKDIFKEDFMGEVYGYLEGEMNFCNEGCNNSKDFVVIESIIFEIDGKEYECPMEYEKIDNTSLIYWGVK